MEFQVWTSCPRIILFSNPRHNEFATTTNRNRNRQVQSLQRGNMKNGVAKIKGGRTWVFIRPRGGGESIPLMVSSNLILNPNIVNGTSKNSLFRRFSAKHLDGQLTSNLVFQILFASRGPVRRVPPPMCRCEQTIDKLHAIRQLDRLGFQSRTNAGHGRGR